MNKVRLPVLIAIGIIVVGAVGYAALVHLNREARAVEDGVVEFKKGNYITAVQMLRPFAESGNKTAQLNVGISYAFGLGVQRDRERAHTLLRRSSGQKALEMYIWIARSLETGDGVKKDPSEAMAWYRIAANEGSAEAQRHVQQHESQTQSG